MKNQLVFFTTNAEKFLTAKHTCDSYGINLTQKAADIAEIQDEDPVKVAMDKAAKAYAIIQQPLVVSDDAWAIMGLNGFPGVYMHSVNTWFTPEDFLRLTKPLQNRKVLFLKHMVYVDAHQQKLFTDTVHGKLLKEIRGESIHPSHTIISLDGDNGQSIAEAFANTKDKSMRQSAQIWHTFGKWYSTKL